MRNQNDFHQIRTVSEARDYERDTKNRPHVVLLGAGASCAAIPHGDKFGKKIAPMKGFCAAMAVDEYLRDFHLNTASDNLEDIYMEIAERAESEPQFLKLKELLESKMREYLAPFRLPDEPTIYDFLLLGLREKDVVATFNWDPMLAQAAIRVHNITSRLPEILFLHGNVGVKIKVKDGKIAKFLTGATYAAPSSEYSDMPLLFPVKNKNYSHDIVIKTQWEMLKDALSFAYRFTIFGYSAPKSDADAIALLKEGWGENEKRNLEEVDIIDLKTEDELHDSWSDFVFSHHFSTMDDFFESSIAKFPRRTCEVLFDTTMNCHFEKGNTGFKRGMSFSDAVDAISVLVLEEAARGYEMLCDPYVQTMEEALRTE